MAWDDLSTLFVDTEIGESIEYVVYRPNSGRTREIRAKVSRGLPSPIPAGVGAVATIIAIAVANNELTGISSKHIDVGKDQVDVSPRVGDARETLDIQRMIAHDEQMVFIEVR